jgi:hypothetical protein
MMADRLNHKYSDFTAEEYLQAAIESLSNRQAYGMNCEYHHLSHTDTIYVQKRLKYMLLDKAFTDVYLSYLSTKHAV